MIQKLTSALETNDLNSLKEFINLLLEVLTKFQEFLKALVTFFPAETDLTLLVIAAAFLFWVGYNWRFRKLSTRKETPSKKKKSSFCCDLKHGDFEFKMKWKRH